MLLQTWACVGRLAAHALSVTQLAFSHDGRHLLSGSRDRSFAVFRRQDDPQPGVHHPTHTVQHNDTFGELCRNTCRQRLLAQQ